MLFQETVECTPWLTPAPVAEISKVVLCVDWSSVQAQVDKMSRSRSRINIDPECLRWKPLVTTIPNPYREPVPDTPPENDSTQERLEPVPEVPVLAKKKKKEDPTPKKRKRAVEATSSYVPSKDEDPRRKEMLQQQAEVQNRVIERQEQILKSMEKARGGRKSRGVKHEKEVVPKKRRRTESTKSKEKNSKDFEEDEENVTRPRRTAVEDQPSTSYRSEDGDPRRPKRGSAAADNRNSSYCPADEEEPMVRRPKRNVQAVVEPLASNDEDECDDDRIVRKTKKSVVEDSRVSNRFDEENGKRPRRSAKMVEAPSRPKRAATVYDDDHASDDESDRIDKRSTTTATVVPESPSANRSEELERRPRRSVDERGSRPRRSAAILDEPAPVRTGRSRRSVHEESDELHRSKAFVFDEIDATPVIRTSRSRKSASISEEPYSDASTVKLSSSPKKSRKNSKKKSKRSSKSQNLIALDSSMPELEPEVMMSPRRRSLGNIAAAPALSPALTPLSSANTPVPSPTAPNIVPEELPEVKSPRRSVSRSKSPVKSPEGRGRRRKSNTPLGVPENAAESVEKEISSKRKRSETPKKRTDEVPEKSENKTKSRSKNQASTSEEKHEQQGAATQKPNNQTEIEKPKKHKKNKSRKRDKSRSKSPKISEDLNEKIVPKTLEDGPAPDQRKDKKSVPEPTADNESKKELEPPVDNQVPVPSVENVVQPVLTGADSPPPPALVRIEEIPLKELNNANSVPVLDKEPVLPKEPAIVVTEPEPVNNIVSDDLSVEAPIEPMLVSQVDPKDPEPMPNIVPEQPIPVIQKPKELKPIDQFNNSEEPKTVPNLVEDRLQPETPTVPIEPNQSIPEIPRHVYHNVQEVPKQVIRNVPTHVTQNVPEQIPMQVLHNVQEIPKQVTHNVPEIPIIHNVREPTLQSVPIHESVPSTLPNITPTAISVPEPTHHSNNAVPMHESVPSTLLNITPPVSEITRLPEPDHTRTVVPPVPSPYAEPQPSPVRVSYTPLTQYPIGLQPHTAMYVPEQQYHQSMQDQRHYEELASKEKKTERLRHFERIREEIERKEREKNMVPQHQVPTHRLYAPEDVGRYNMGHEERMYQRGKEEVSREQAAEERDKADNVEWGRSPIYCIITRPLLSEIYVGQRAGNIEKGSLSVF